jgi:uncharacterized protein
MSKIHRAADWTIEVRERKSKWIGNLTTTRENAMDVTHDAVLLRVFTSTADRFGLDPLYHAIVLRAREMRLAGATVIRGSLGFGQSAKLHKIEMFRLSQDLPVVVEIVDTEEKIKAFLPVLDEMIESGFVTLETAKVLRYDQERAGILQRITQHFRPAPHVT